MKLALLADIHANLEALETTLIAAEKAGAQRFFSLGDAVGYGVDPVACLNRLQEVEAVCILGNHDQAMVDTQQLKSLNSFARDTILRSREWLGDNEIEYLQSFAFRRVEFGSVFAHANPIEPEEWEALFLPQQLEWCMSLLDWPISFFGHTHHSAIYCQIQERTVPLSSAKLVVGHHKYLVNPGSVGQPRDGDWRASFALWDLDQEYVELHRVEYPVERTQEKMQQAGWPTYVAERLSRGE